MAGTIEACLVPGRPCYHALVDAVSKSGDSGDIPMYIDHLSISR